MDIEVIWGTGKRESFCGEDWTGQISLIAQENFSSVGIHHMPELGGTAVETPSTLSAPAEQCLLFEPKAPS